jgi:putative transposase
MGDPSCWRVGNFSPENVGIISPETTVAEIIRKLGVSEATFYAWKKKFGAMGTAEIRELRQLREENSKLKRLVADLSLDKTMLQEVIAKKW